MGSREPMSLVLALRDKGLPATVLPVVPSSL